MPSRPDKPVQSQTYRRKLKALRKAVEAGIRSPIVEGFSLWKFKAELDANIKPRRPSRR